MEARLKGKFILLALLLIGHHLFSQGLNFIQYNTNNSRLPNDIIYQIRQGDDGYLWICTDDGLVRFDGTEMRSFGKGFVSRYVIGIDFEAGKKWVCTWKGGIHMMAGDSAQLLKPVGEQTQIAYSTNNIIVFNDIIIAYVFKKYYVFKYNPAKNEISLYRGLNRFSNGKTKSTTDGDEYYKFCKLKKQHRLYAWDSSGVFEVKNDHFVTLRAGLKISTLFEDDNGVLYALIDNTIYRCDTEFSHMEKLYSVPSDLSNKNEIQNFRVLPSGNICISLAPLLSKQSADFISNPNFYWINVTTGETINLNKTLFPDALTCWLTADKEGGIWLASDGQGVFHLYEKKYKLVGAGDSLLKSPHITALYKAGKDSMYVGTSKGIYLLAHESFSFLTYPGLSGRDFISRFCETPEGHLLVNSSSSSARPYILTKTGVYKPHVNLIAFCGPYELYSDSTDEAEIKDKRSLKIFHLEPERVDVRVRWFKTDGKGKMWLGSPSGVWTFDPDSSAKKIQDPLLKHVQINRMDYVNNVGLVLATNSGLLVLDNLGRFKKLGGTEGILGMINNFLFESPSSVWIGSQQGLYHLQNGILNVYKRRDGLISDDVSALAMIKPGQLAVGSSKGLTFFDIGTPGHQAPPELIIEKFSVNGKDLRISDAVIKAGYNTIIALSYHAITFVYPELLEYQYRLNHGGDWISTHNRQLVFTDIKPGEYNLEIRAKKYNSEFSQPLQIHFIVEPPWYRTLWAISLFAFTLVGITALVFYIRLRKQRGELLVKQELAELRLKALQAQLNPHFISNALSSIQFYILHQDEVSATMYLGRFSELTRLFLEASRSRFITLANEIKIVENYLSLEAIRFANKFSYELIVDQNLDAEKIFVPGLLIQPFVENSINHGLVFMPSGKKGHVCIDVRQIKDQLVITVNDNGIGRKRSEEIYRNQKRVRKSESGKIMEELQMAYNTLSRYKMSIITNDKYNSSGEAEGTEVRIILSSVNDQTKIR